MNDSRQPAERRDRADAEPVRRPRRTFGIALIGVAAACLLGAVGVLGATRFADDGGEADAGDLPQAGTFVTEPGEANAPADVRGRDRDRGTCYQTAYMRRATTVFRRPDGRPRTKLSARSEWGSARVLGVVDQRDGWVAIQAPELENGEVAWIRKSRVRLGCSRWALHVDLSERRLVARKDRRTVRAFTVGVGRPDNPTPRGRFTVTDKLRVTDESSPYGCCALALTGHQPRLPAGWPGGDRLAVHATTDQSSIGQPVSSGCMRAPTHQARWLIHTIPIGAPIFIRA